MGVCSRGHLCQRAASCFEENGDQVPIFFEYGENFGLPQS